MESNDAPEHMEGPAARVVLAPAHNALNSLALLGTTGERSGLSPWIRQTRSSLSPHESHLNRLITEGLGDTLLPEQEWDSFPAYVDDLAQTEPEVLRDELLGRLVESRLRSHTLPAPPRTDALALLADVRQFVAVLGREAHGPRAEVELLTELHSLLQDPPELQDILVTHFRSMWEVYLAAEWERTRPILEAILPGLRRRLNTRLGSAELVQSFLPGGTRYEGAPDEGHGQQTVFILSPHLILSARSAASETTRWIFFGPPPHPELLRTSAVGKAELLSRLRALADEINLEILVLAAEQEHLTAQEVMARLDLSQPNASRHLQQLSSAGYLIERRQGGATKQYRIAPAHVALTFQALERHLEGGSTGAHHIRSGTHPEIPAPIRRFFNERGRLAIWPARREAQVAVLTHLASCFEPDRRYSEQEVNVILNQHHTWRDPATLRREMYNHYLLDRTSDGARYWRGDRRERAGKSST